MIDEFSFRKLDDILRLAVPQLVFAFLFLASAIAWPFVNDAAFKPNFVLMALYYWAIYRPTIVPPAFCFVAGLLMDILTGVPVGLHAALYVLIQWLVCSQRRFLMGQPYLTTWFVFGLVMFGYLFLQWGLMGLSHFQWSYSNDLLIQAGVTFLMFPFVTMVLVLAHRVLPVGSS